MCVIIYVPKESTISKDEIQNAWYTNPDGAGYSIQKNGKVFFKRGFMSLSSYLDEITPLIGNYNLLLHFRISTSKAVNKVQTHPYKKGDVTLTEGTTMRPVICMNGIITGQKEYKDCNDTMSYIIDNQEAFSVINQNIINIIEENTGAKWAVMKPDEVLLSSQFEYKDGRYYSNKNHLWRSYLKTYTYKPIKSKSKKNFNNMITGIKLKKRVRRDKELYNDVMDFIDTWCNGDDPLCDLCTKCLKTANNINDVKKIIRENYYCEDSFYPNDNFYESWYNDIYDYNNDCCCNVDFNLFDE